jgi:hypothetical protein
LYQTLVFFILLLILTLFCTIITYIIYRYYINQLSFNYQNKIVADIHTSIFRVGVILRTLIAMAIIIISGKNKNLLIDKANVMVIV